MWSAAISGKLLHEFAVEGLVGKGARPETVNISFDGDGDDGDDDGNDGDDGDK